MVLPPADEIRKAVQNALSEDVGGGDITTRAIVPITVTGKATMVARESLVVSGLSIAERVFQEVSSAIRITLSATDGQSVVARAQLMEIHGPAAAILTAERVALNFVQRLSGIATLTRQFVEAIAGTKARILDTRKTTPGLRLMEKYAVACGGGVNHRIGLFDAVLIKDNHLATTRSELPNPIAAAIQRARAECPGQPVEVEVDTLEQVDHALAAGADVILLDNMNLVQLRLAVQKIKSRARTEASGGVTLATVRQIAETGVDAVSVGALTHSARAVDIALDFEL